MSPAAIARLDRTIATIALGQVGVSATPTVDNFNGLDCSPYATMDGPQPPNSNGCGVSRGFHVVDENEEWCADFVKWVWQRAGVTADMDVLNAGANSFYRWGLAQGETLRADSGAPAVGDAVVFYPPGPITTSRPADHVGIVIRVNRNSTIDMVNGDFAGPTGVTVQYDTGIRLSQWAGSVWGTGERWVFVTPPRTVQEPAPVARIGAPHLAVAGTPVSFMASAAEPGGSITSYHWTFGDGAVATGQAVSHVFANAGLQAVTMTATSSFGTSTTRMWNVDVVGGSSAVASVPSDAVWYSTTPVLQHIFLPSGSGRLVEENWDGRSWQADIVPGHDSAGGGLATLNYPAGTDSVEPQVFFRSPDGLLAQTSSPDGAWATSPVTGDPAAGSDIVATTVPSVYSPRGVAPAVFYFNQAGQLSESAETGGVWTAQTLPGPMASHWSLALADGTEGGHASQQVFYPAGQQRLAVISSAGGWWHSATIWSRFGVAADSPLSAISGDRGSSQSVFFIDASGRLAEATPGHRHMWLVRQLPGPDASVTTIAAVRYLLASGAEREEAFYLSSTGQPVLDWATGPTWRSQSLPGAARTILGVGTYPDAGGPQQLFLGNQPGAGAGGRGVDMDSTISASSGWTSSRLPDSPATFADRILLYGATPAAYQTAVRTAEAAGLPSTQATDSFANAWAATMSGDYLVIGVGQSANNAMRFNACGWANPSAEIPGSTPFYVAGSPLDRLPGADAYEDGTAASSGEASALATDLTYYALHGRLPAGVRSLPAAAEPQPVCYKIAKD
jgi:PKD repeat protein